MPISFIISLLLLAISGVALLLWQITGDVEIRQGFKLATIATIVLGGLFLLIASANIVPTRNVGIVTSFNKPTGAVTGAGLKWVAPWQKVDSWDASRQSFDHKNERTCVQVRITGLQTACVEVQIEWSAERQQAPEQWASYKRTFEFFVDRRVDPNLTGALNDTFANHDPLANVDTKTGAIKPPVMTGYVDDVKANVEKRIGNDVVIHSVVFGFIRYNDDTQKSIEAYQQKLMTHRNLLIDEQNAKVQKRITELNAQVDARMRCLEIVEKKGGEPGLCMGSANPVQVTGK